MSNTDSIYSEHVCPLDKFARRFVQRWDLYARQLDDGRYICIREPLDKGHLLSHLIGEITLGMYLLSPESYTRHIVLDADDEYGLERLSDVAVTLVNEGTPAYLEMSRRGGHLWLFLPEAVPGRMARRFAKGLTDVHGIDRIEVFPKQDELSGGPGSLIRMPFGVHRLSGKRYGFVRADGEPISSTISGQVSLLSNPETVPMTAFEAYQSHTCSKPERTTYPPGDGTGEVLSERIKAAISVMDFVGQYVELTSTSSGAVGLCPFHDDNHPSFSVNTLDNYWHCFAGCGGGSVIDFWMKWKGYDFLSAVKELAELLL